MVIISIDINLIHKDNILYLEIAYKNSENYRYTNRKYIFYIIN